MTGISHEAKLAQGGGALEGWGVDKQPSQLQFPPCPLNFLGSCLRSPVLFCTLRAVGEVMGVM